MYRLIMPVENTGIYFAKLYYDRRGAGDWWKKGEIKVYVGKNWKEKEEKIESKAR